WGSKGISTVHNPSEATQPQMNTDKHRSVFIRVHLWFRSYLWLRPCTVKFVAGLSPWLCVSVANDKLVHRSARHGVRQDHREVGGEHHPQKAPTEGGTARRRLREASRLQGLYGAGKSGSLSCRGQISPSRRKFLDSL